MSERENLLRLSARLTEAEAEATSLREQVARLRGALCEILEAHDSRYDVAPCGCPDICAIARDALATTPERSPK